MASKEQSALEQSALEQSGALQSVRLAPRWRPRGGSRGGLAPCAVTFHQVLHGDYAEHLLDARQALPRLAAVGVGDEVEVGAGALHIREELLQRRPARRGVDRARAEGQDGRDRDLVVGVDEDEILKGRGERGEGRVRSWWVVRGRVVRGRVVR